MFDGVANLAQIGAAMLNETNATEDLIMLTMFRLQRVNWAGHALLWLMTLGIFLGGCSESARTETPGAGTEGGEMVTLAIDLQDGFSDDTVVIRVDGQEIFHKEGVNTDYSLGRADSVEIQVPEGSVNVEVTVPSRHLSDTIVLEVSTTVYLGVSILDDRIDYRISDEMFLYF